MLRRLALPLSLAFSLLGCAAPSTQDCTTPPVAANSEGADSSSAAAEPTSAANASGDSAAPSACEGEPTPPPAFAAKLEPIEDPELLASALGEPTKGMLCQGEVYEVTETFTIYRAWNSTNPGSELGKWWAFSEPAGSVAQYREDYEICYQWSPLDKMTRCTLEAGTKIVVGNGQSAYCSEYLSYPASATLQIYLEDADSATEQCEAFTAEFAWTEDPAS